MVFADKVSPSSPPLSLSVSLPSIELAHWSNKQCPMFDALLQWQMPYRVRVLSQTCGWPPPNALIYI